MSGFEAASTETLRVIEGNLRRGLDVIGQRIADGSFHTVGAKGAAPPSQAGHLTLALLDGVTAELARRTHTDTCIAMVDIPKDQKERST